MTVQLRTTKQRRRFPTDHSPESVLFALWTLSPALFVALIPFPARCCSRSRTRYTVLSLDHGTSYYLATVSRPARGLSAPPRPLHSLRRPGKGGRIVDLSSTEDTTLHERWAPAVTHETIREDVHAIREEVITREIHNHHVFHRVLPIVDIEVLPARHFVPVEGGYAEISEDEVPGRTGPNTQWVIAETMSKMLPESKGPVIPQHFSASRFEGPEYNDKEYVGEDGVKRTEQWWVHPPTIETGGRDSGQTYPFYIGFPEPKDNGLRARLPKGNVIGVSPLLARQQREQLAREQELAEGGMDGVAKDPSAAPEHKAFI